MKVTAIKTRKVLPTDRNLLEFLGSNLPPVKEGSVIVITSKVAAILEGAVVSTKEIDKKKLVLKEADYWLPPRPRSKYDITLTIKNNILNPSAGIDESNGGGWYILWPKDPQKTVNAARKYLMKKFRLHALGVIMTDSVSRPLLRGTIGICMAHSGFLALKDYVGTKDLFGRKLKMTKANHAEALAAAAVLLMGEGAELKPLAVIEDVSFLKFKKSNPSSAELAHLRISIHEDLYAPILGQVRWKKGRGGH